MSIQDIMATPRYSNSIQRALTPVHGAGSYKYYCELTPTNKTGTVVGGKIILPMPTSITSSTGASWEQADSGLRASIVDGKSATETSVDMLSSGLAGLGRQSMNAVGNVLGDNGAKTFEKRNGALINPAKENYFRGSDCRSMQLSFILIPLSANETTAFKEIIKNIQANSVPSVPQGQTGRVMFYPASWKVSFNPPDFLPHYKEAVITNMSVDYSAVGKTILHDDGGPVQINLNVSFTELTILTQEDVLGENYG